MASTRSWTHRMLLGAARGGIDAADLREPRDGGRWDELAEAAAAHGMQGRLAAELRGNPAVPPSFQVPLQAAALRTAGSHRRLLETARDALTLLNGAGIEALVVKGPALVERYYDDPTIRPYGDVDLVVPPRRLGAALRALETGGYVLTDRNWEFLVSDLRGQVHVTDGSGSVVELHWHLVNGSRQRKTLHMAPTEMWEAAQPATVGGVPCLVLPPEEELAHLALHAAMHGCNRLIWLVDVAVVAQGRSLDWDRTVRRLRRWGFATGGGLVLSLAAEWTGAAVPPEVRRALVGRRTARAAYRWFTDRWDLGEPERRSQARGLFFATAGDRARTVAALAADVVVPAPGQQPGENGDDGSRRLHRLTIGTLRRVRTKLRDHRGGDGPSEYVAVGDPETGRRSFLDAVARASEN